MTGEKEVKIELNSKEAELFKLFRQHQEKIERLFDSNALPVKNGSLTLHFNSKGQLMKIEKNSIAFTNDN